MEKIKLGCNISALPMPVSLIGTMVEGKANFAAIAWINRANYNPPLWVAAINKNHWTMTGIRGSGTFSVNFPSVDLLEKTDYCGIASGRKVDKSTIFDVFYGNLATAPMIKDCPLTIECRLYQIIELPFNALVVGEAIEAYSEERFLTDGKPDLQKIRPFVLTMPDNRYWSIGEPIGKAWSVGKSLM